MTFEALHLLCDKLHHHHVYLDLATKSKEQGIRDKDENDRLNEGGEASQAAIDTPAPMKVLDTFLNSFSSAHKMFYH